jgi:cellulose synthase/poly-beta-1,6-N-acetylglucosamine synthase-like glycosyltransferase
MSEDVAVSFDLIDRGWKTSFRPDALVTTRVPTTLDQFWQQRQRWTRGLTQEIWHAHNITALQVVLGYADRLVFFSSAVAAIFGWVMWFWPVLYFIGPALNILVALHRARVTGRIMLLFSCIPMFVLDLFSTIVGTVSSLCRKKSGWMPIRQRADKE